MKTNKPVKLSRQALERKILELEAQLSHRYAFADTEIHKAGTDRMMGSGVLIQISALGGKDIINPVIIRDGLSKETIAAIREDLKRSYAICTLHKPKDIE